MLLSVRIYTHPRGVEMDEEGGERNRSPSSQKSISEIQAGRFVPSSRAKLTIILHHPIEKI
jgi:hypothetical protein